MTFLQRPAARIILIANAVPASTAAWMKHNARTAPFHQKRDAYPDEDEWPNQSAVDVNHTCV